MPLRGLVLALIVPTRGVVVVRTFPVDVIGCISHWHALYCRPTRQIFGCCNVTIKGLLRQPRRCSRKPAKSAATACSWPLRSGQETKHAVPTVRVCSVIVYAYSIVSVDLN
ncbi:hypothetical protein COO60DRAFT_1227108 [Scenedesmus sp. NREL 46B-D3]|nr:hypothetical protein COO60DRAFT_1227108 [Scenedesmus sp. NREL 46B-D3]